MQPSEDQIKELMTTVACAVCGANFQENSVEVLGHRDVLWFLRVSCATCGLVAAMVKASDSDAPRAEVATRMSSSGQALDRAPSPGPVTGSDVSEMRKFLANFDGNFQRLFEASSRRDRPAA